MKLFSLTILITLICAQSVYAGSIRTNERLGFVPRGSRQAVILPRGTIAQPTGRTYRNTNEVNTRYGTGYVPARTLSVPSSRTTR